MVFNPINTTGGKNPAGHPKVTTTFTLDSNSSTIINLLIYTCSVNDECDRDFVLYHSLWLLEQNYNDLHRKFTNLLIKTKDQPIHCIEKSSSSSNVIKCINRLCTANTQYTATNLEPNYSGGCARQTTISTIVRIIGSSSKNNMNYNLLYTCAFDRCNNVTMFYSILNLVQNFYNVSNYIYWENIQNRVIPTTTNFEKEITFTKSSNLSLTSILQFETTTTNNTDQIITPVKNNVMLLTYQKSIMKINIIFFILLKYVRLIF